MALYHKHRPQTFHEVIGQEHIIKTITNQITGGRVSHAYLFSGPRGVGKTTTARLISKSVNCKNKKENSFEPCDTCESCKEISESRAIDVIEIDAASYTGVDNVRENIIDNAQFRPTKSKYKVFIIDEVHMLSTSAFNALLKILEEPPEYIIFILATTELHKLPDTIISRCQRFNFKKVPFDEMEKQLKKIAKDEGVKVDDDVIERIIYKSDNCVRDAISLLDQIMASGEKHITADIASIILPTSNVDEAIQLIEKFVSGNTKGCLEQINKLSEEGVNLTQFANDTIELLRIMIVSKANSKTQSTGFDLSKEAEKSLQKIQKDISAHDLVLLIDLIIKRRTELKSSTIPQLPLELAAIEWCERNTNNAPIQNVIIQKDVKTEPLKKEIKETVNPPSEIPKIANSPFTLQDIENKWSEFLQKMEKESTSLAFILKSSSLSHVHGNTLTLSVSFSLHKDKLMATVNIKKIETILSTVMSNNILLDVIVKEKTEVRAPVDNELQDLTAAFGGEIIN